MADLFLTFTALSETQPGAKWQRRWQWSWPAYEAWFIARGGDTGPDRFACRTALCRHMPELVDVYDQLVAITGGSDRAARFLSTWCPPAYLGGCSLAAKAQDGDVRLVRNYDLSPDLNEGFLLRSEWTGRAVMGMVEFLWGLSDGINDAGLTVALAYGGRSDTAEGFGITTILRYVLETCDTVDDAFTVLRRVPSHMAYNLVLADATGATASVEILPGGGARIMPQPIATNHQQRPEQPERPEFTRTFERYEFLRRLDTPPEGLRKAFLHAPLRQERFAEGFGTLFTAEYRPLSGAMRLDWPNESWEQSLYMFREGERRIDYSVPVGDQVIDWSRAAEIDWFAVAQDFMCERGQPIEHYVSRVANRGPGEASDSCPDVRIR